MHVGKTFGPFELEKELGSGAMGTVYRARFQQDGKEEKTVALKVIAFGLSSNEQALNRFERESDILKQLRHPNIVRLFATGRYKGTPFFAMEYVEGRSLDKLLAERIVATPARAPFTWEEVVEFGRQLCAALQHAHDRGIIHRDLKPSNLMLTREGILKLTDFGIAKDVDVTALTGQNNTIGTAAYMSPEQCKGERNLTGRSDLYSLGVVFYELLTGRKPFQAESSVDMFLLHVSGTFTRPAQLNPEIPVWLDTLVCQMMEKKPEHRPRDAAMVGQVLEEIAEKVAAQVSAGADAATARASQTAKIGDAEDRSAAKFIRAGAKKKKLRKKRRPFYTHGWFVGLACLLVIGTFGWAFWKFALAPPTAESLLERIKGASDPVLQKEYVADYLKYYRNRDDEETRMVKALDRDFKVKERELVLLNRHKIERLRSRPEDDDDPEAYQKTMAALSAENEGDLAAARSAWVDMARAYQSDAVAGRELWGWHAQKKLNDLTAIERQVAALLRRIDEEFRLDDKDIKFETDLEQRATTAIRLEQLRDYTLARDRWGQIAENLKGDVDRRSAFVYAKSRARDLEAKNNPKDADERAELIRNWIGTAQTLLMDELPARRRQGRNHLRDIRDLYAGSSGKIANLVETATELLARSPK